MAANDRVGKKRRLRDRARPVRLRRIEPGAGREPVASARVETRGIAACQIIVRDRRFERGRMQSDQPCELGDGIGLVWRHLRPDGALEAGNFQQHAVENRENLASRRLEMNPARDMLPGLVHEASAFVEEPPAIPIDNDAIGVDEHDGRRIFGARIDRLDMHAVPVA